MKLKSYQEMKNREKLKIHGRAFLILKKEIVGFKDVFGN
jgi:hypothetical protein